MRPNTHAIDPRTMDRIVDHITKNEKIPPNPYLDIKGNITVGAGLRPGLHTAIPDQGEPGAMHNEDDLAL